MFLEKSKSRIEAEFAKRAAEVPAVKEAEKEIETYRPEVALALKFLYTTMPLSDVGNYGVSSFLDYAEHGVFLWENSPYVKKCPRRFSSTISFITGSTPRRSWTAGAFSMKI